MNAYLQARRMEVALLNKLSRMMGTTNYEDFTIQMDEYPDLSKIPNRAQRRRLKRNKK